MNLTNNLLTNTMQTFRVVQYVCLSNNYTVSDKK